MTDRSLYHDRDGRPIPLEEWADLMEDDEYRRVGLTHVGDIRISTVWLGIDHSWYTPPGMTHIPIIYETMVFGADELEMERYATLEEAQTGHEQMVEMVRTMSPDQTRTDQ